MFSKIHSLCLVAVCLEVAFGQAFSMPGYGIESNAFASNANMFLNGKPNANEAITTNNVLANNYVSGLTGKTINDVVATNNVLSASFGSLSGNPINGVTSMPNVNEIVSTSNALSNNIGLSGNAFNGLSNEVVTTNNVLTNNVGLSNSFSGLTLPNNFAANFAPTFTGTAINAKNILPNNMFASNLTPALAGNPEIVVTNNLLNNQPFGGLVNLPGQPIVQPIGQPIVSEVIPNLQIGDVSLTGDLPIGGTIKISGRFPVYGMIAVEGSVPSTGSAAVNTGCTFSSQVLEPACVCANQVL